MYGRQRWGNLPGMMRIVINHQHLSGDGFDFTRHLEAPPDPLETCQRLADCLVRHTQLGCNGNRRQCVEHIVPARKVQSNVQCLVMTLAPHAEVGLQFILLDITCHQVSIGFNPVGNHWPGWRKRSKSPP